MTIMGFQYVYVYYIHGMDYGTYQNGIRFLTSKKQKDYCTTKISFFIKKIKEN